MHGLLCFTRSLKKKSTDPNKSRMSSKDSRARDMAAAEDRHMREEKLAHNLLLVERSTLLVRLDHATRSLCLRKIVTSSLLSTITLASW